MRNLFVRAGPLRPGTTLHGQNLAKRTSEWSMDQLPQLPDSGNQAARHIDSSRWIDLIAFLAVLALGGALIALSGVSIGSVVTTCTALGWLYGVWKRPRAGRDDQAGPGGTSPR
jgi:hypothetical protein